MSLLRTASVLPRIAPITLVRAGAAGRQQFRGIHIENYVGHNTPFGYTNKRAFTLGYWAVISTLFATPFLAVKYQLMKGGY